MIAEYKVQEVERLLRDTKFSQRRIAKLVGVSRTTIGLIASGQRPDYAERRAERALEDEWYEDLGPLERCPGCGGKVHMPCRLCRVRRINEHEQQVRTAEREESRRTAQRHLLVAICQVHGVQPAAGEPPRCNGESRAA